MMEEFVLTSRYVQALDKLCIFFKFKFNLNYIISKIQKYTKTKSEYF